MPPGDAAALAGAFATLAADSGLVARMGAAARARVLDGFTERDVMEAVKRRLCRDARRAAVTGADRAAFIRANTRLLPVPHAPEIRLHLADEATELWQKTEEELGRLGLPPPFWAFAWAGGQALARYLLDHPEVVRGQPRARFRLGLRPRRDRRRAGRRRVGRGERHRCLRDRGDRAQCGAERRPGRGRARPISSAMTRASMRCSPATSSTTATSPAGSTEWLSGLARRGATVLIGDPGRSYLRQDRLERLATYEVPVTRALEDSEVKKSSVWRFRP